METKKNYTESEEKAARKYPGVAIDRADDNRVDAQMVKDRTCTLNNNPRNDRS